MTTAKDLLMHEDMMIFKVKLKYLVMGNSKEFYKRVNNSFMTNKNLKIQEPNLMVTQVEPYIYFDLDSSEICSEQWNDDGDWLGWKVEKLASKEFFKRLLKGK